MGSGADPEDTPANTTAPAVERAAEHRTFLIADIRGYTRYTDEHGDEAAAALAVQFAKLVREVVEARDGDLLELRGDEALTVFASARQALRAAVELQGKFGAEKLPRGVGMGLDTGEAVAAEGGYRGTALNVAARLCAQAGAGEILATETVIHLAARIEGIRYREPRTVRLKGLGSPVRIVGVVPEGELVGARPRLLSVRRPTTSVTLPRPALALVSVLAIALVAASLWASNLSKGSLGASPAGSSGPVAIATAIAKATGSPGSVTPSAAPSIGTTPASWVPMAKGGPTRTSTMPGPGPEGEDRQAPVVRWQFAGTAAMGAPPSMADDRIYVGDMAGTLHVLDFATGKEVWSYDAGAPIRTTPTIVKGSVYLTSDDGRFQAIDVSTHQRRWEASGAAATGIPTVVGDVAYLGLASGRFEALSTTDGQERWHVDLPGDVSLNAITPGTAFVTGPTSDRIFAIDLATGSQRWQRSMGVKGVLTPAISSGVLFVAATDDGGPRSRLIAFDATTGAEKWRFLPPDGGIFDALAVTSDFVYASSSTPDGTTLWALEPVSGQLAWPRQILGGPIQPAMVDDRMYLAARDGSVRALEARDGDGLQLWNLTPGGPVVGAPIVTGGSVIVATANGGTDSGSVWAIGSNQGSSPSGSPDAWSWVADLTAGDGQIALYLNVAIDARGNVYAADRYFNRVVIWGKSTKPTIWGRFGTDKGEFNFGGVTPGDQSQSVAIAADGRIAVGDGGNHRVQIFDSKRRFIRAIGREGRAPGHFVNPCCVAFDPQGQLYVADPGRGDIQVFDKSGRFVRIIGSQGSGEGQFDRLGVPYIDPTTGLLWVPDYSNRRVEVVGPDGTFIATYGDGKNDNPTLAEVNGVALDSAGRMFVVDGDDFVWVLDSSGKLITKLGPTIPGHGSVAPSFIVLTADGKLYLPDAQPGSNRVVVMQLLPPLWPPP